MSVLLRLAATRDVEHIAENYDRLQAGLSKRFRKELDEVFDRLDLYPLSSPTVDGYGPIRRAHLRHLPHMVFYLPEDTNVVVLRVMHSAQSPESWPS